MKERSSDASIGRASRKMQCWVEEWRVCAPTPVVRQFQVNTQKLPFFRADLTSLFVDIGAVALAGSDGV